MKRQTYKLSIALFSLFTLGVVSSCYKDHSTGVTHPLEVVDPTSQLQELYEVEFGSTLTIQAPQYKITNGASVTPTIEWEVDYKKVSTTSTLAYTPTKSSDYGIHPARLKMQTPDGTYYHRFRIRVNFKYREGLYALTQQSGKTAVGYYPFGQAANPVADIFTEGGVDRNLTGTPQTLSIFTHTTGAAKTTNYLFVGADTWGYRMNADSLKVIGSRMNFNGHTIQAHIFSSQDLNEYVVAGGNLYTVGLQTTLPRRLNDARLKAAFSGTLPVLAGRISVWRNAIYSGGLVLFDETTGTAIVLELAGSGNKVYPFKATYSEPDPFTGQDVSVTGNPFSGSTLLDMSGTTTMSHVALLTHSASSSEYTLAVIEPNLFLSSSKAGTSYPMQRIIYKGTDSPTHLALRPEHNSAYVAAGNKIYLYDLQRQVTSSPEAYITLGASETIQSMVLSGGTRLYIATYDGSAGAVYSYDVSGSTAQQLWRDASLGKVTKLVYREPR